MIDIKICGLTNLDDARAALEAGADFLGFVLYPKSPRGITATQLARLADALPREARLIGVFVNEARKTIERIAGACRLHAVQIHGDEPSEAFAGLAWPVWRAVRWQEAVWQPAPGAWNAERYVADAPSPHYGGTGEQGDWGAAAALAREQRVMLAGGLTPDNVAEAIRAVRPLGVDVSSGVEQAPGRKDVRKVEEFVRRAREAAADREG